MTGCLLVTLLAACSGGGGGSDVSGATDRARAFLRSWSEGKLDQAAAMTDHADAAKAAMQQIQSSLGAREVDFDASKATVDGRRAKVAVTAHWLITGMLTPWTYDNRLTLVQQAKTWRVQWSPAVVHPQLKAGQTITATRTLPPRAQLQDAAGHPLFTPTAVVTVGIEPRRVQDLPSLAQTLAQTLHISAADITRDVGNAASPTQFVPVITLRRPAYDAVRAQIHDLPGTVFSTGTRLLPPTTDFGRLLLGQVGPPSADLLKTLGDGYLATDQVGVSGLQAAFNKTLTGQAGATVQIMQGSKRLGQIGRIAPKPGTDVHTTIDRSTQSAADAALATVSKPASIVAVRPSTGAILAVANSPSTPYDIAVQGQYPAGSTFKIITAAALLQQGAVRPDAQVECPGQTTVYGKVFHN
jgi:cell division protein FtsI/penicillin-binding protein 2